MEKRAVTPWQLCRWAYGQQRVHRYLRTRYDWFLWEWADIGADPDGPRPTVHRDAAALHRIVELMPQWAAERIVLAASTGERPEPSNQRPTPYPQAHDRFTKGLEGDRYSWADIAGRREEYLIRAAGWETEVVPVYEARGRKRMVQVGTETKSVPIEFCPLVWEPDPVMWTLTYQLASQWWAAMRNLERRLRLIELRDFTLVVDETMREPPPWLEQAEIGDSRSFDIAQAAAVDAIYSTPPRGQRTELRRVVDDTGAERQSVRIRHARARLSPGAA